MQFEQRLGVVSVICPLSIALSLGCSGWEIAKWLVNITQYCFTSGKFKGEL